MMNLAIQSTASALLLAPLAAQALQPLTSDDTGTQGAGRWQVEAGVAHNGARQRQWNVTLTRGLAEPLDLYIQAPYTHHGNFGSGWNDTGLGLKWRLAEQGPFSLAVKPEISLPIGDGQRGLGTGRAGASATLLAQWKTGPFILLANAALVHQPNWQGDRRTIWQFSGAALYRVSGQLQLALDAALARNPTPSAATPPAFLIAAAIYAPRPWLDLSLGYRHGLNRPSDYHAIMLGLTARW